MSSYHQKLQDSGLFAFDGDEGEATAIFKEVFEKNPSPNENGNFELLGLRSEDSELLLDFDIERTLANERVLEYQILEKMKYKVPIEVGEASNYSKVAKKIDDLAEERMEKIPKASLKFIFVMIYEMNVNTRNERNK